MKAFRFILVLICLLGRFGMAFSQPYLFRSISSNSGLPNNFVQSISSDRQGFIWLSTYNGLVRYDGYSCKLYPVADRHAGNATYQNLRQDGTGRLWMTLNGRMAFYDEKGDSIESDPMGALCTLGLKHLPKRLIIDKEGGLWMINSHVWGYYDFKQRRLQWFRIPGNRQLVTLEVGQGATFLLFTNHELWRLDLKKKKMRRLAKLSFSIGDGTKLYPDSQGRLWCFTQHVAALACLNSGNGKPVAFPGESQTKDRLITCIAEDGKGDIWIGSDNRGILVSSRQGYANLTTDLQDPFSVTDNHIQSLYLSATGLMWVGTSKAGALFTTMHPNMFIRYTVPRHDDISCFAFAPGTVVIGFDSDGMALWHPADNSYQFYSQENGGLPSDMVVGSYTNPQQRIWLGTYGGGIFTIHGGNVVIPKTLGNHAGLRYVRLMTEDQTGCFWVGTFYDGIYCYRGNRLLRHLKVSNSGLPSNAMRDISCRNGRWLYVATSAGVAVIDTRTGKVMRAGDFDPRLSALNDELATDLFENADGTLCIGTRNGLLLYSHGRLTRLTDKDGLSGNEIFGITADRYGSLWVSTTYGLTRVMPVKGSKTSYECQAFLADDGIGDIRFNLLAIACAPDGNIFVGGNNGFLEVKPNRPHQRQQQPCVLFSDLYVGNKTVAIDRTRPVVLDYGDNFALTLSTLDYPNLRHTHYLYRLDDSQQWIDLTGNRIQFDHLMPGHYTLQVKTNLSSAITSLAIRVRPPFYLSWPAQLFYLLLLALTIVSIYRRNIRWQHDKMEKRARELEEQRKHKLDEERIRFFTNISHDLRTPLSLILIPLEQLLKRSSFGELHDQLQLIYRNACLLRDDIRQILDFNKLGEGRTVLSASRGDIVTFVEEVCNSFRPKAEQAGLTLVWHTGKNSFLMDFDHQKLQRILFNLLSNAVKYNTSQGSIDVSMAVDGDGTTARVILRVADTGIGIQASNKAKIFDRFYQEQHDDTSLTGFGIGLNIVAEYVKLMKGTIEVTDNQPRGTVFTVTLPAAQTAQSCPKDKERQQETEKLESAEVETEPKTEKPHVLLVDDNDDFRDFLAGAMKEKYIMSLASNGQEALERLASDDIQLVVSDVMMPVMDGLELCRRIKSDVNTSHIPVILLTARTADEQQLDGLRQGADDYIAKPFNLDILEARIDRIITWTKENYRKFRQVEVKPSEITVTNLDEQFIDKAIKLVEDHIDDPLFTVEQLSTLVGLTRGHFYKKLMAIVGMSPLDFIRTLRIKRGRQLLEQSDMNISQIAYSVGLSPKIFAKYFKETYGKTPTEYREKA